MRYEGPDVTDRDPFEDDDRPRMEKDRLIALKWAATCVGCGRQLETGTLAWWCKGEGVACRKCIEK